MRADCNANVDDAIWKCNNNGARLSIVEGEFRSTHESICSLRMTLKRHRCSTVWRPNVQIWLTLESSLSDLLRQVTAIGSEGIAERH